VVNAGMHYKLPVSRRAVLFHTTPVVLKFTPVGCVALVQRTAATPIDIPVSDHHRSLGCPGAYKHKPGHSLFNG
jgi:hypothetical protein